MKIDEERIALQEKEIEYLRDGIKWQNILIEFLAEGRTREELWAEWEDYADIVLDNIGKGEYK